MAFRQDHMAPSLQFGKVSLYFPARGREVGIRLPAQPPLAPRSRAEIYWRMLIVTASRFASAAQAVSPEVQLGFASSSLWMASR
jgi:hypothetical protein